MEWIATQQRSKRELGRALGVSEWSLSRWCKQYGKAAAAGGSPPPRRPAGWSLGDSLAAPLVGDAFERGVYAWSAAPDLHHSDRGANRRRQTSAASWTAITHNPA